MEEEMNTMRQVPATFFNFFLNSFTLFFILLFYIFLTNSLKMFSSS